MAKVFSAEKLTFDFGTITMGLAGLDTTFGFAIASTSACLAFDIIGTFATFGLFGLFDALPFFTFFVLFTSCLNFPIEAAIGLNFTRVDTVCFAFANTCFRANIFAGQYTGTFLANSRGLTKFKDIPI